VSTARANPLARVREMHVGRTAKALLDSFAEHDLLTYASAIAFQAFFALIPLTLTALGILGALHLQSVWTGDIAPGFKGQVSGPVFQVVDDTVRRVFRAKSIFWATLGAALTVWEVSGAMRAVMTVLDRIYRVRRERSWRERYAVSIALSALVILLLLLAGGVMAFGHIIDGILVSVLRWPIAAALLLAALAAVVRWAPARQREWHWVSFGSGVVVVAWLGMSAGFSLYLREIADYGSIFGNLATLLITLEYLYLTAIVFLGGLAIDGLAQQD
jgi:membrane protein